MCCWVDTMHVSKAVYYIYIYSQILGNCSMTFPNNRMLPIIWPRLLSLLFFSHVDLSCPSPSLQATFIWGENYSAVVCFVCSRRIFALLHAGMYAPTNWLKENLTKGLYSNNTSLLSFNSCGTSRAFSSTAVRFWTSAFFAKISWASGCDLIINRTQFLHLAHTATFAFIWRRILHSCSLIDLNCSDADCPSASQYVCLSNVCNMLHKLTKM